MLKEDINMFFEEMVEKANEIIDKNIDKENAKLAIQSLIAEYGEKINEELLKEY